MKDRKEEERQGSSLAGLTRNDEGGPQVRFRRENEEENKRNAKIPRSLGSLGMTTGIMGVKDKLKVR